MNHILDCRNVNIIFFIYKKIDTHANFDNSSAMCSTTDPALIDETFKFALKEAKDQDFYMFVAFLARNTKTRRRMSQFFKENYDEVCSLIPVNLGHCL